MLKESSILFNGITEDAELFRKSLSITPFDDDESQDNRFYGYNIRHSALGLSESVKGINLIFLKYKVQQVVNQWIIAWNNMYASANHYQKSLQAQHESLDNILLQSLDKDQVINLDDLKVNETFEETSIYNGLIKQLSAIQFPPPPKPGIKPPMPVYNEPKVSFSQTLLLKKKDILNKYEQEYDKKLVNWQHVCEEIDKISVEKMKAYEQDLKSLEDRKKEIDINIEEQKNSFLRKQEISNEQINVLAVNYLGKQSEAVEQYFDLVMIRSSYPEIFPRNVDLEYHRDSHHLFVDYELPDPEQLPKEKEILVDTTHQSSTIAAYSDEEFSKLYNEIVFNVLLRTLHEIFAADYAKTVEGVSINGWVRSLNKGNGQFEKICIATLFCSLTEFEKINLHKIDPTLCFKFLKGVSAPLLSELTPVPSTFIINKRANGHEPAKKVLEPMDGTTNLANLGMQEFEKNLMDLFELEFGMAPGEIRLQNDAQDGSFEALGFDPEPIRGGKFIIQARKNTKSVSIAAVKELFGSVIHEGALKGILVTTSDFTSEAYEFSRNKPIILLNGNQLLSLFEKHGLNARINFREAISLKSWLS